MAAATSDNVTPLALAACERFGSTLTICRETRAKAERLIETPKPIRNFLGAYIGYSAGDCAMQLAKSVAGVQFLSLAAALVTTIGAYHGGLALEAMLRISATDITRVPTASQLSELLAALEYRCTQSRFAEMVVYFRNLLVEFPGDSENGRRFWANAKRFPDADGVLKLVNAFAKLKRTQPVGQEFLDIRATWAAPWVLAFTMWCLGEFPSVYLEGSSPIHESNQSHVTVIVRIGVDGFPGLDISFRQDLNTPGDLVSLQLSPHAWSGMVGIQHYGQWLLRELDLRPDLTKFLVQILPYALRQTVGLLHTSSYRRSRFEQPVEGVERSRDGLMDNNLLALIATPFAKEVAISDVLSRMLQEIDPTVLQSLPDGQLLKHLPTVVRHLHLLKQSCRCGLCPTGQGNAMSPCLVTKFFWDVARLVTDILCLSLFDTPNSLLVSLQHQPWDGRHDDTSVLVSSVYEIITTGNVRVVEIETLLKYTLGLVGHEYRWSSAAVPGWPSIISSVKGQVVYLKIFSTNSVPKRGYLELVCIAGRLEYTGKVYARGLENALSISTLPREIHSTPVTGPMNLFPALFPTWQVIEREEYGGYLSINLLCREDKGSTSYRSSTAGTLIALQTIAQALVLEVCPHFPDALLQSPDDGAIYVGPNSMHPYKWIKGDPLVGKISCVAVNGDKGLRMVALGSTVVPTVLRGRACMACALQVCRDFNVSTLIL